MVAQSCCIIRSSLDRSAHTLAKNKFQLKVRGSYPGFHFRFAYPHFVPLSPTLAVLEKKDHPLRAKFQRRYDNMDPNVMWACFTARVKDFKQGIVRSHYRRQLRRVFNSVLRERGLDRNGRAIIETGPLFSNVPSPIRGTILFSITSDFPDTPPQDLRKSCTKVIERIEGEWRKYRG
jgi:hypothetical protein